MNRSKLCGGQKGFTLLEILIAIAVIAMLAVLSAGVLGQIGQMSRATACASNLRQIGVALSLYATEHHHEYPPNRANRDYQSAEHPTGVYQQDYLKVYLVPYTVPVGYTTSQNAGPFWCPADEKRKAAFAAHSYGVNTYRGGSDTSAVGKRVDAEPCPAYCLYLIDMTRATLSTCTFTRNTWPFNGEAAEPPVNQHVDFRHGKKANGLFVDGHVQSLGLSELKGREPNNLSLPAAE